MKKLIICISFLLMIGGKCFSQSNPYNVPDEIWKAYEKGLSRSTPYSNPYEVPDELWETFKKGLDLGYEGKWEEAFSYFKVVADKGNVACAQKEVAVCYQNGEGVSVNFKEAFNYMYKAATNPKPWITSFGGLADFYRMGIGTPKNLEEAFKWYRKGAEAEPIPGNLSSYQEIVTDMYQVGCAYLIGAGVKRDGVQGVYWLRKADENGHPEAKMTLAMAYLCGAGIPKDEVEGVQWLKKSAETGNANAQYELGNAYMNGVGNLPKDDSKALEWFKKAASQGYTSALDKIRMLER